jgi:hypothetical protein
MNSRQPRQRPGQFGGGPVVPAQLAAHLQVAVDAAGFEELQADIAASGDVILTENSSNGSKIRM